MAENKALPKGRKSIQSVVGPVGSQAGISPDTEHATGNSPTIEPASGEWPPEARVSGVLNTRGTAADDMLLLDNQLCFAAYALSREITGMYRPYLDLLGITYTQYITLLVLWESRELTMKALGERLFLDSGTLTPLLKKLSRLGLVEKERAADDERVVIVRLTGEGLRLRDRVADLPVKVLCDSGLDAETAAEFRDRMKQLSRLMRDAWKKYVLE